MHGFDFAQEMLCLVSYEQYRQPIADPVRRPGPAGCLSRNVACDGRMMVTDSTHYSSPVTLCYGWFYDKR
jgi:hypothetical protein